MYCRNCGKDVGNAAWCPYCGTKQEPAQNQSNSTAQNYSFSDSQNAWGDSPVDLSPAPRTNTFAVVGLILAFFSQLLGLIFSIIGLVKANEYGSGRGLAITGIIVSVLLMIFSLISVVLLLIYYPYIFVEMKPVT